MRTFNLNRNLLLGYLYIFLFNLTFWYGTWMLFFLSKVTYGELGIIQSVALFTTLIAEVPTGAIADIIGKKKALLISAALIAVGEILVPLFPSFWTFLLTGIVIRLGLSFFSGTMDAYMYDSLASAGKTEQHPKVLSCMSAMTSGATALASILGGLLFLVNFGFPWYLTFAAKSICFIVALFMVEPLLDTEKIDFANIIKQNVSGFKHLMTPKLIRFALYILTFSIASRFIYEVLDDTNIVEAGLNSAQIGTMYAIFMFLSLPISSAYAALQKRFSPLTLYFFSTIFYAITQLLTPLVAVPVYLVLFTSRIMISPLRTNSLSQIVNEHTPSKIRATTFSTIELISALPFVILSFPIGLLMQQYTSRVVTGVLGAIMLILLVVQFAWHKFNKRML